MFAAAAVLLAGCEKEHSAGSVTLRARLDGVVSGTKVEVSPDGRLSWKEGDEIAVWTSNGSAGKFCTFVLDSGAGTVDAVFSGTPDPGYSPGALAVYPASAAVSYTGGYLVVNYPDTYTYNEGNSNVRMAAYFSGLSDLLSFRHLGGMIRVSVSGIPLSVNCFRLVCDHGIAGNFAVSSDMTAVASAGSEAAVSVNFTPGSLTDGAFDIPVPVGTGFSFTGGLYKYEDDRYICYSSSYKTAVKSIGRGEYMQMRSYEVGHTLSDDFLTGMGSYLTEVTSLSETKVSSGLVRMDVSCKWRDELVGETEPLQRKLYVYAIDLDKNTLRTTIPFNDESALWSLQKPSLQLRAFQNATGIPVLGGVNGDYFEREETGGEVPNRPYGVLWKGGICLKADFTPWEDGKGQTHVFAILKDGSARIWQPQSAFISQADPATLRDVVCGRLSVIQNGRVLTRTAESLDPRTAVGIDETGHKAWLIVIDGRNGSVSNGASCFVTGKILSVLGAYNAFNLDGGASATFVALNSSGVLAAANTPCNAFHAERAVANCIAICPKEVSTGAGVEDLSARENQAW